jgi:uncharacterized protein YuzE
MCGAFGWNGHAGVKMLKVVNACGTDHMKVNYDSRTDILTVILKDNVSVAESDEDKPRVILDYDATGELVSLEILDASRRVSEARKVEFQMQD